MATTSKNFLKVLVDPPKATVDIIAVHGLNPANAVSHAYQTWTTSNDKLWLRDFLPQELPHARVLLFGYNSNVAFETAAAGVRENADSLLNGLKFKRTDCLDRPIVFVAHSLGGIVLKRALVEAKLNDVYQSIRLATYGIAFFSTPHQGGNYAALGDIVASIARGVLRNPSNSFLKFLKKDSYISQDLIRDFRHQLEDYYFLSFYETLPLGKVGLIVDKKSATLGNPGSREKQIAMDADHSSICKFASAEEECYQTVSKNLVQFVQDAEEAGSKEQQSKPIDTQMPTSKEMPEDECPTQMPTTKEMPEDECPTQMPTSKEVPEDECPTQMPTSKEALEHECPTQLPTPKEMPEQECPITHLHAQTISSE